MTTSPALLTEIALSLRSGRLDLRAYLEEIWNRIDRLDGGIQSLLPEPDRRGRLLGEAAQLDARYSDPKSRPALYGVLVGVKDIFSVDGFPTRAGSQLPAELFAGPEAACVSALRAAGGLILGKTVTTEFAYREPGATCNPHDLSHTPGGSSSGSAAAVAAGFCSLALGTQTIGSVIRPAAFCCVVGFKPSYGRIPTAGLIFFSESADHVGLFTQDVAGMRLAASIVCRDWQPRSLETGLPALGVPEGPYLSQASAEGLAALERNIACLKSAGYSVRNVPAFEDISEMTRRHTKMIAAEMARVHATWYSRHSGLYRPQTAAMVRTGQEVTPEELAEGRASCAKVRSGLKLLMEKAGIDLWISPAAPGPAPEGLASTGDPAMNLPWTHAGLPTVTVPAGSALNGLPLGLQVAGDFWADEKLLDWAGDIAAVVGGRM